MRHAAFVIALLLVVSCAPQKGTVVATATKAPLNVIGTSTPLPTDAATPLPSRTSAPKETGTPQQARADPRCLEGPGQWVESSSTDQVLTSKLALELMYGSDSNAICTDVQEDWSYTRLERYPYFAHLTISDSIRFEDRVVLVASVAPPSKPDRFVAITAQTCEYCSAHGAGGQLYGAIFTHEGDKWQAVVPTHYITEFGSWGEFHDLPENKQLVSVGPDKYGIILKDTNGGQGISITTMIVIAEVGGRLQTILDPQEIAEDGSGFCLPEEFPQCWHHDSEIDFVPGDDPDFMDLQVTTRGTDYDSDHWGQLKDASRIRLFQFKNGKYVAAGS